MREKSPIPGAKIVQARLAIWRLKNAIFRAAAIAHFSNVTFTAIARQGLLLGTAEGCLRRTLKKRSERGFTNVSQPMLNVNEMIALIEISVVLDDRNIPAGRAEDAKRMSHPIGRACSFFKALNDDPVHIVPHPLVKDRAEKISEVNRPGFHREPRRSK